MEFKNPHSEEIRVKTNRHKGFTLSEVLITLVIIGVVAAITAPILYANYQKEAAKAALKKNFSVLQQVNIMYYIENGEKIDAFTDYQSSSFLSYIKKFFNVQKDCKRFDCVNMLSDDFDLYKTYNGKAFDGHYIDDGHLILVDGTSVYIEQPGGGPQSRHVWVWFDINGYGKKPNQLGKDLFAFELTKDGEFLPMGAKGTMFYGQDGAYCSNTSQGQLNGINCTYKVLMGK